MPSSTSIPSIPILLVRTGTPIAIAYRIFTLTPAPAWIGAARHIALEKYGWISWTKPVIITLSDSYFFNSSLGVIVPYINLPEQVARKNINKNILFYGAMNRMENEISAEWFIKNVMPEIKDTGAKYVIVGNKPSDELKKYESDNVIITGFVQDIQP